MTTYLYPIASHFYHNYVPTVIARNIESIQREFIDSLETPFKIGGYLHDGNESDYLKSKSIYIAPNPFDLRKLFVIYAAIGLAGCCLASLFNFWVGGSVLFLSVHAALSDSRQHRLGNHLREAVNTILSKSEIPGLAKTIDQLNSIEWTHSDKSHQIDVNPEKMTDVVMKGVDKTGSPSVVFFKVPLPSGKNMIKAFYIGEDKFIGKTQTKKGIVITSDNLLNGKEIKGLLELMKNKPLSSQPSIPKFYHHFIPSLLAQRINAIYKEAIDFLEKPYNCLGKTHDGNEDPYLKSKTVFIAPNPFDLKQSLQKFALFGLLGYCFGSVVNFWGGVCVVSACAYAALFESRQHSLGNHLEKALNVILSKSENPGLPKDIDQLKNLDWKLSETTFQIEFDPAKMTDVVMRGVDQNGGTAVVFFKIPRPDNKYLIKAYYIGKQKFVRMNETKNGNRIQSNNLLNGEEIKELLKILKPQKTT